MVPIQKSTSRGGNEFRLSFPVDEKPTVDYGTIIISDDMDDYEYEDDTLKELGNDRPKSTFFTCYPGSPGNFRGGIRDEKAEALKERLKDPTPLTVREVREKYFDGKDFGVNYQVRGQ